MHKPLVVLVFNTLKAYHRQFETQHLNNLIRLLRNELGEEQVKVLAIVNSGVCSIADRGDMLQQQLSSIL